MNIDKILNSKNWDYCPESSCREKQVEYITRELALLSVYLCNHMLDAIVGRVSDEKCLKYCFSFISYSIFLFNERYTRSVYTRGFKPKRDDKRYTKELFSVERFYAQKELVRDVFSTWLSEIRSLREFGKELILKEKLIENFKLLFFEEIKKKYFSFVKEKQFVYEKAQIITACLEAGKPLTIAFQIEILTEMLNKMRTVEDYNCPLCSWVEIYLYGLLSYCPDTLDVPSSISGFIPLFTLENAKSFNTLKRAKEGYRWWSDEPFDLDNRIAFVDWMIRELEKQQINKITNK